MYDLSRDWYRNRMDVDWSPPTAKEIGSLFAAHGLVGPFWRASQP
jgi:hypothetical protein